MMVNRVNLGYKGKGGCDKSQHENGERGFFLGFRPPLAPRFARRLARGLRPLEFVARNTNWSSLRRRLYLRLNMEFETSARKLP